MSLLYRSRWEATSDETGSKTDSRLIQRYAFLGVADFDGVSSIRQTISFDEMSAR